MIEPGRIMFAEYLDGTDKYSIEYSYIKVPDELLSNYTVVYESRICPSSVDNHLDTCPLPTGGLENCIFPAINGEEVLPESTDFNWN